MYFWIYTIFETLLLLLLLLLFLLLTNEKIKVMLSRKRCRDTLQYYNKGEISECQSKLWTNRNVFSWCLNGTREETVRRHGGRLSHARGAATGKTRSPMVDLCTGWTTSVDVVDDRRWRRLSMSAVRRMFSASYAALIRWGSGVSERRDGMLFVPEPAASEARGEAEWCAPNAWRRIQVEQRRWEWQQLTGDAGQHLAAVVDLADD